MKVALIHDWLTGMRGGEKCLKAFLEIYPQADIFTLFHIPGTTSRTIDGRVKQVSFLNSMPGAGSCYRHLLPLYPLAVRQFDLRGYDLIISLSHAAAKNVKVPCGAKHVVYCFTPMRYIWDQAWNYFGRATPLMWPMIRMLRAWDCSGANQGSRFVGISRLVAARIKCFYGQKAAVIYPPVDASWIAPQTLGEGGQAAPGRAFLCAGALVPYKRIDLAVQAFNANRLPLWIAGSGPEELRLRKSAGSNIKFFGKVTDGELAELYRNCRALVVPGKEDFGLIPVECMAAGRPVIALYDGGCKESVAGVRPWIGSDIERLRSADRPPYTGVFVRKSGLPGAVSGLISSVQFFVAHEDLFYPRDCIAQAVKFSPDRFLSSWKTFAETL